MALELGASVLAAADQVAPVVWAKQAMGAQIDLAAKDAVHGMLDSE